MKIRSGFVSNSSSSSFIVISDKGKYEKPTFSKYGIVRFGPDEKSGEGGKHKFGRENEITIGVISKINFSYIQAYDVNRQDWIDMLEEVIKEETGVLNIEWLIKTTEKDWEEEDFHHLSYIDHQSSSIEGQNTQMFDSKKELRDFIFNSESYIQGGNDNE